MHRATPRFWRLLADLPEPVRKAARSSFQILKRDQRHPSLSFKKVGAFWSARVDHSHRALAVDDEDGFVWVWIGAHDEYERLIRKG